MQKIIINNFGAVRNADIDIKKVLILIGEQASGKSTIAKLIYFFRSLRDDLMAQIYSDAQDENYNVESKFITELGEKFNNLFGSTQHMANFEITFHYSVEEDKFIRLTLNDAKTLKNGTGIKKLSIKLSTNFFDSPLIKLVDNFADNFFKVSQPTKTKEEDIYINRNLRQIKRQIFSTAKSLFHFQPTDNVFIVAGRNATVSYSDLFEKYLFSSIESKLERNSLQPNRNKISTVDLELMSNFIKYVSFLKEQVLSTQAFESENEIKNENKNLTIAKKQMDLILKGRYIIDDFGERIRFGKSDDLNDSVLLSNASSGQQEVIRILQDLILTIDSQEKTSRIIEEPEAHLFPIAQKQLVELFALMVNQDIDNQLIITTHSPYILAAFNNLLFAKRVIEKNPNAEKDVSKIVAPEFRLDSNEFVAYSLSHSEKDEYCTSIMSDRGLISENYLDTVSDVLNNEFNVLYKIHAKTFARK
jgi:predicted ATPase